MPPRAKKSAANQHDKRHENGLVPPGKRIPKQKSNQNLNGFANGKTSSTPPPLPPADVAQSVPSPPAAPNGSVYATLADANMAGGSAGRPHDGRERSMSDLSLDARPTAHAYGCDGSHGAPDSARPLSPRRFDANANNVSSAYKGNALTIASTILASCPLQDVIAILIILLQLGPTALTIVHFLYAALTFVPPTSPTSLSTLPSLTDMFQGSGGSPSLGLIIFVDMFILIIWLLLWVPLQNFILDLAQAVIAISLGGAAAGGGGTTNSMILCVGIILASHFGRCGFLRQHLSSLLSTALSKGGIQGFRPVEQSLVNRSNCYAPHGWVRSLLGVHILAQGILRLIRRTLSRREQQQSLAATKKVDPESGVILQLARRNSGNLEANPDHANASSTDGRPPGPPPVSKEKEKVQNSKRKRRQATHVRSQQPFWAAIASTKVTVLKEMEQSNAANDADEANAWDMNHIGNAAFKSEGDSVWISNVSATEIAFGARLFQGMESRQEEEGEPGSAGVDKSKPFYVRLNGAVWSSTRIREISTNGCVEDGAIIFYKGEIHGLTAFSNYHVEFVRVGTDEVLNAASLITSPSPSADTASSSPASHPTLRPASPTTTLKKSIAAAEQQLQDTRNRLKKNKKDHKSTITSLKREVEALNGRLSGSGSTDDRQRQRILQLERDIKQAKETAVELEEDIQAMGDIPEEEHDEHCAQRQAWLKEKNREASENEELERLKTEANRNASQIQSDITSAAQKRERLLARQAKLLEQYERLLAAKVEGKTAKDRKAADRAALALHRGVIEQQYRTTIEGWERDALSYAHRRLQMEQQIQYLDALHQQQLQQASHHSIPPAPEGVLPGTTGPPGSSNVSGPTAFPAFQFPPLHIPPNVNQPPGSFRGGRGRSSSMLSEVSGFTDELEDTSMHHPASAGPYTVHTDWSVGNSNQGSRPPSGFFPNGPYAYWPAVNGINGARKGSGGSGSVSASASTSTPSSGSGSINGSQRDPMSPVPASVGNAAMVTMSPTAMGILTPWSPGGGNR